ncbi:MAG: L-lactate dehydrogenase [Patescibacteria group bacterium]|jgi:L-lactate dehydrogenase
MSNKVTIIGAGNVGSATAFTLALSGTAEEIVLLDTNLAKAQGEVMDIEHGSSFLPHVQLTATKSFIDIKQSNVVIITAGAKQTPGETRLDLLKHNAAVTKDVVLNIKRYAPNCVILVVVNPVDILTYLAYKYSSFPKQRVFGSGTVLDTARFRSYLAKHFNINSHNVHAYIMGEHGDSSFPMLSTADIGSIPLTKFPGYSQTMIKRLHQKVVKAAYNIIQKKGYTNHAIAICVNQLVHAILNDTREIFCVSSVQQGTYHLKNIALSTPAILGKNGIEQELILPLNRSEQATLQKSAKILKKALALIKN